MTFINKLRKKLDEIANHHNLSGNTKVTLKQSYGDDCVICTDTYKDEIYEESGLPGAIASLLQDLPIDHLQDVYSAYTKQYPPEENQDQYLWDINGETLCLDEVNETYADDPLYDVDLQNVNALGTPRFEESLLEEFLSENMWELPIEWDEERFDYKRGYVTATATITLTLDAIMDLQDHVLAGWSASLKTPFGMLTVE